ncbi:MAG: sugar phosphate isomerase/epimerase [Clostridia bacterium]|nr:sugar phosphate isomerase/epimerase [Clostridia bacterium]
MKIGISTASFFTKEATENTFDIIKDLGIDTCEVFLTTFREYKSGFAELLRERRNGINAYSIHTLNVQFEPELFNIVARTREDSEIIYKEAAVAAGILGAKYYTFHGPTRMKRTPYCIDLEKVGRRLDELDEMLQNIGGGCRIAYENVHWTFFNSPEYFLELKKHTSVRTCLDIKQAMQSKYSVYDYIDAMGDRLVNVHLCDFDDSGKLYVPGKGTFDFVGLFRTLLDRGYEGPALMELYAGNYRTYEEIKEGRDYLQYCLEKASK